MSPTSARTRPASGCTSTHRTTPQALRRDGGSDPVGLKSMTDYAIDAYDADTDRVFVTTNGSGWNNACGHALPGGLERREIEFFGLGTSG